MLTVVDRPDPPPGPGQIAIDVSYAAVGLIDVFLRQGLYKDRPGLPQPPFVPGLEVAGTVRGLGPGVAGFAVGDRVVRSRRPGTRLPYDRVVDSSKLPDALAGEKFDVIIDPVGGAVRTHSIDLLAPAGRLILAGNASGEWGHQLDSNRLWYGGLTVSGFNAGSYIPTHPQEVRPGCPGRAEGGRGRIGRDGDRGAPVRRGRHRSPADGKPRAQRPDRPRPECAGMTGLTPCALIITGCSR